MSAPANDPDLLGLSGAVALVIGAARSIGRGCARQLARAGCDVAVVDVADAHDTVAEIESMGRRSVGIRADVLDATQVDAMVARAVDALGPFDVAVNTVGGTHPPKPFLDLAVDEWTRVLDLNALATMLCCQAEARAMLMHGVAGRIVNVASLSGVVGAPNAVDYGAANAAVLSLTASVALELAGSGIRVNCIVPGATWTETVRDAAHDPQLAGWVEAAEGSNPLGRLAEVDEMGTVAVFLASRLSSYVTGQGIVVDGGMVHTTARPPLGRARAG
jgi:NAD(P)-dependent dehydrogenase (short-subunit alcohol dehydrogenase family)